MAKKKMEYEKTYVAAVVAAVATGCVVAPPMTVIDRAIIRSQLYKIPLWQAKAALTRGLATGSVRWNPALSVMTIVYGATYLTANLTDAACPSAKDALTSAVNCSLVAWKDREYARLYLGTSRSFPVLSYLLFGLRDGLTIVSSFRLKHQARQWLEDDRGLTHHQAELVASLVVPASAQLASAPLHIVGVDLCDRPRNTSLADRFDAVRRGYASVCAGRVLRILPAFGLGGCVNDLVREALLQN